MVRKVANILLYDDQKRFLFHQRTDDAPTFPGEWGVFGGGIEEGETPKEAVKRECFEELEYKLINPKIVLNVQKETRFGARDLFLFMEKYNSTKKLILHEGQKMAWIAKNELKNIALSDFWVDIIEQMYEKI
ncbi:MAG: NUDIX domain-containing protein [Candidatus Moraniibacteriota bacterium]